jgi:hypothetical protein
MRSKTKCSLAGLGFLLAVAFWLLPGLRADEPANSREISSLLSDAHRAAALASWAAADMEQYRFSGIGWESHTNKLTEIKEIINTAGRAVTKLNERRNEGSAQQRQDIDRITFALSEVVGNIELTLHHLREHQQDIESCVKSDPEYKGLLRTNLALATKLAELEPRN